MQEIILSFVIIMQIIVPAFLVYKYENTLKHGEVYRFNVSPIDPYDPFRGRYVYLDFELVTVQYNGEKDIKYGQFVYANLDKDENGHAVFNEIFTEKPKVGNYLKVKFLGNYGIFGEDDTRYNIGFIFDRYYSQESKALKIENAVSDNRGQRGVDNESAETVSARVRIKDGLGVIEELYIGELTIHEYLAQKESLNTTQDHTK